MLCAPQDSSRTVRTYEHEWKYEQVAHSTRKVIHGRARTQGPGTCVVTLGKVRHVNPLLLVLTDRESDSNVDQVFCNFVCLKTCRMEADAVCDCARILFGKKRHQR